MSAGVVDELVAVNSIVHGLTASVDALSGVELARVVGEVQRAQNLVAALASSLARPVS